MQEWQPVEAVARLDSSPIIRVLRTQNGDDRDEKWLMMTVLWYALTAGRRMAPMWTNIVIVFSFLFWDTWRLHLLCWECSSSEIWSYVSNLWRILILLSSARKKLKYPRTKTNIDKSIHVTVRIKMAEQEYRPRNCVLWCVCFVNCF